MKSIDSSPDLSLVTEGKPESRILVPDCGVLEYDSEGQLFRIWTRYGSKEPNPWLNEPAPNVEYFVGANLKQRAKKVRLRHWYRTAFDGTTETARAFSMDSFGKSLAGSRFSKDQSSPAGFPNANFDRGHLIAAEFGAGMEAINLVSMPNSVNRSHLSETARKNGFELIADQGERYRDSSHHSKATLTGSSEFATTNYRNFEGVLRSQIRRGKEENYEVSIEVSPSTVGTRTDIIYAVIWADKAPIYRYKIECDIG